MYLERLLLFLCLFVGSQGANSNASGLDNIDVLAPYVHHTGSNNRYEDTICPAFTGRWLLGVGELSGLCNQLTAVFAYAKVAEVIGASGLILGPLYSRLNFMETLAGNSEEHHTLPFGEFFDVKHYTQFWAKRNLQVLTGGQFKRCLHLKGLHTHDGSFNITEIPRPRFYTFIDEKILDMVDNHVTQEQSIGGDFHVLKFTGYHNMVAFYDFHQSGPDHPDLRMTLDSLVPAENIQLAINSIAKQLPHKYFGVHMRIEPDIFIDNEAIPKAVSMYIESILSTPTYTSDVLVYIASGIYQNGVDPSRREIVDEYFSKANIRTTHRELLKKTVSLETIHILESLHPEQLALIDLEILRYCDVFIPSNQTGSSFGYTVQRLRDADNIRDFELETIPEVSRFMWDWGYRRRRT